MQVQLPVNFKITDPLYKPCSTGSFFNRFFLLLINDKRDMPFIRLCIVICVTTIPAGVYLFLPGRFSWWFSLAYFLFNSIFLMGPFILMLHNTSHRLFFKRKHNLLNKIVPWLLGPFFGETPESYFAHHIGMHHPENNLSEDLSSTMSYQRDSFADFMRYFFRFFIFIIPDLSFYLKKRGRKKLVKRFLSGEFSWYIIAILLICFNWKATIVVFIFPLLFTRFMMMAGNWAQHAFIDLTAPANCYRNSITCINSSYNRQCFNDGYHIGHHLYPSMHWSDLPLNFEQNIGTYQKEKSIIFRKLDYFQIWIFLMIKNYKKLASYYVELNIAQQKTSLEVIALLKERTMKYSD